YREELAVARRNLALALRSLDKTPEAEECYRQAIAVREKLATDFPAEARHRIDLANAHKDLGDFLKDDTDRPQEAVESLRQAVRRQERLLTDQPGEPDRREDLASSLNNLGIALRKAGQVREAEAAYRQSLGHWEKLAADKPDSGHYRQEAA